MKLSDRLQFSEQRGSNKSSIDLQKLVQWLQQAETSTAESRFREEAEEDYRMYAGDQDDPAVLAALAAQRRPTLTFNEIKPKVDMLIGLAAQAKNELTIIPQSQEDEPLAELMNGVFKHFYKKTKLSRKLLEAFEHTVKCGRSLLHFYIKSENPFSPEIVVSRIPSYSFWIDPDSVEYDLSDARFIFIDKWLSREEILTYWPNFDVANGVPTQFPGLGIPSFFNEANEKYRIVECWYRKPVLVYWIVNPVTGKEEALSKEQFEELSKLAIKGALQDYGFEKGEPIQATQSIQTKVFYSIFTRDTELESGESPYSFSNFPCVLLGAYKAHNENRWFGVINMMKDPQRSLNTMRRQLSHLLQTLPKGIMVHEAGAVLNIEEFEERGNDPTFHLEVANGKIDGVRFVQQPQISPIYQQLDQVYSQSMKDASGIQDTLMGIQTSSREPGITVAKRQETGLAVLYMLYDNYAETRLACGRILLRMIQQFITFPMVVRIEGDLGAQLAQINTQLNPQVEGFNDISVGEFDIDIDETVETRTSRMAVAEILSEYSHNNPGVIPPDIILEYSNVPFSVKQRVKQSFIASQQAQQEEADFQRKLETAKLSLEELKIQSMKERISPNDSEKKGN